MFAAIFAARKAVEIGNATLNVHRYGGATDSIELIQLPKDITVEKGAKRLARRLAVKEKTLGFDPDVGAASGSTSVYGYYQSEQYFGGDRQWVQEVLRKSRADALSSLPTKFVDFMGSCWTAVHVRRGDYLHESSYLKLPYSYYTRALTEMDASHSHPRVLFCENARECEDLSPMFDLILDGSSGLSPWQTMALMSKATNIITANSTFSWWAAYLSDHDRVIQPSSWFNESRGPSHHLGRSDWIPLS